MNKHILVTGGAGYIGSIAVKNLLDLNYQVTVLDDLSTGFRDSLDDRTQLICTDLSNVKALTEILSQNKIFAIFHFAGKTIIPESVALPLHYYETNYIQGVNLLHAAVNCDVKKFIFSSTAAVYGHVEAIPVKEETLCQPMTPYGRSKRFFEMTLQDIHRAHQLDFIALRYFNVAGASEKYNLGQKTKGATHLIKVAAEVACGKRDAIHIFGNDYPTLDGSAVRDFIHVEDLVAAHIQALKHLESNHCSDFFNCGYGRGTSVFEILNAFEKISKKKLSRIQEGRRQGDAASVVADVTKIKTKLLWTPKYDDIELICKSAFDWEKKI